MQLLFKHAHLQSRKGKISHLVKGKKKIEHKETIDVADDKREIEIRC